MVLSQRKRWPSGKPLHQTAVWAGRLCTTRYRAAGALLARHLGWRPGALVPIRQRAPTARARQAGGARSPLGLMLRALSGAIRSRVSLLLCFPLQAPGDPPPSEGQDERLWAAEKHRGRPAMQRLLRRHRPCPRRSTSGAQPRPAPRGRSSSGMRKHHSPTLARQRAAAWARLSQGRARSKQRPGLPANQRYRRACAWTQVQPRLHRFTQTNTQTLRAIFPAMRS